MERSKQWLKVAWELIKIACRAGSFQRNVAGGNKSIPFSPDSQLCIDNSQVESSDEAFVYIQIRN